MSDRFRVPYVPLRGALVPMVPVWINWKGKGATAMGLVDSGAAISVLPYELGLELGLNWDDFTTELSLTGNLAKSPAKVVLLNAHVGNFPPIELGFAWTKEPNVGLILGQVNFFEQFQVCFFGGIKTLKITKNP